MRGARTGDSSTPVQRPSDDVGAFPDGFDRAFRHHLSAPVFDLADDQWAVSFKNTHLESLGPFLPRLRTLEARRCFDSVGTPKPAGTVSPFSAGGPFKGNEAVTDVLALAANVGGKLVVTSPASLVYFSLYVPVWWLQSANVPSFTTGNGPKGWMLLLASTMPSYFPVPVINCLVTFPSGACEKYVRRLSPSGSTASHTAVPETFPSNEAFIPTQRKVDLSNNPPGGLLRLAPVCSKLNAE
jgi:hypothetical protein